MPLYVRPFGYFFYRYVLRLGFLDGKEGFIFHFMQAFWYRLLVDINRDELRASARTIGKQQVRSRCASSTRRLSASSGPSDPARAEQTMSDLPHS